MTLRYPTTVQPPRHHLDWRVVALTSATFLAVSYALCVLAGLLLPPGVGSHQSLAYVLPGFVWLTWRGFLIGLVETFAYGLYAGALFAGLYNLFTHLFASGGAERGVPRGNVVAPR